jgi:hypothetical protein
MKGYTHSEAREYFATVFEEAERHRAIFRLSPAPKSTSSPLDLPGVKVKVKTQDLVAVVCEGRNFHAVNETGPGRFD